MTSKNLLFLINVYIGDVEVDAIDETTTERDFSDRQAVIKTNENFYIGDHTVSIKHKKLSWKLLL